MFTTSASRVALSLAALFACTALTAHAELKLGTPFSDGMVLQRNKPATIWGLADPNAAVKIQLGTEQSTATADAAGHFSATLPPLAVGGPYTLKVSSGSNFVSVQDVLSGDIWLCAGQSNMQLGVNEDVEADAMRAAAKKLPKLRLLSIPKAGDGKPAYIVETKWRPAAVDTDHFAAVGFHLGLALSADPKLAGVPIGLIDSSFGGTSAEGWVPKESLGEFTKDDFAPSMFGLPPSSLYNHMIAGLGPMSLTGVVWYQGENNSGKSALYPRIMKQLIGSWRKQFHDADLPFVIVQLPPFGDLYAGYPFTWEREAQAMTVQQNPHTGLVVSIDTTNGFNLHPGEKGDIGRRAALQAQRLAYHEDVVADGPTLKSATADGPAMRVTFDTHDGPLVAHGGQSTDVTGFALAGSDGVYHFAHATITGKDTVLVQCVEVRSPQSVRYAWGSVPSYSLYNTAGLPAGPFRTDHQTPNVPIEVKPVAPSQQATTATYSAVVDGNGNLASFGVARQQFISNSLEGFGNAAFFGIFGPRGLQHVTPLTPSSTRYSDSSLAMTYSFEPDALIVRIDNRANDKVDFNLRLAEGVTASPANNGYTLARGSAKVQLTGDGVHVDNDHVKLSIEGNATRTLTFRVDKGE